MPQFRYRAVDDHNRPSEGALDASDAREVVQHLERQGLQATSVEAIEWRRPIVGKSRLSAEDLDLFNEQLLAVVKSGLPLAPSLATLAQDVSSRRLRAVIEDVRHALETGHTLEQALARHPESFSPVYRSLVRAGEMTGNLSHALSVLAAGSSGHIELRHRVQEAVAYPILVMLVAAAVLLYFVPATVRATSMGNLTNSSPVGSARYYLVVFSEFMTRNGLLTVLVLLALVAVGVLAWHALGWSPGGRMARDRFKVRIPMLGSLLATVALARFTRTLSMLLAGRVALPDSLRLAGAASGNAELEEAAHTAAKRVETGRGLGDSLNDTQYFRQTYCWLVRTGEERGQLEYAIRELADAVERSATDRSRWVARVLGPVMTVVAATIVGAVVLIIYLSYIQNALPF